jgi:predicted nucleotidyltransferase
LDKVEPRVEQKLSELVERLKRAFDQHLISVVLYGSAASSDWNQGNSDLNILCVLDTISPAELRLGGPILRWWREAGNPSPLLLTEEEVQTSTDCFPIEFHDMQQHRRVLFGADLIEQLSIDNKYYRAQVEHEFRSKQLRLRQRAAEVLSEPDRLQKLMTDSVSTFCVLARHVLVLKGDRPYWDKKELVRALEREIGSPLTAINEILSIRTSMKRVSGPDSLALFGRYLAEIRALADFVDKLFQ